MENLGDFLPYHSPSRQVKQQLSYTLAHFCVVITDEIKKLLEYLPMLLNLETHHQMITIANI